MPQTKFFIMAGCAILLSACCEQPQPVAVGSPNSLPAKLTSSFEDAQVVQKIRVVELVAECDPRDVEEIHKMTPAVSATPGEFYERLSRKMTSAKFTTLVETRLPHGQAQPKGEIHRDNELSKFDANVSAKGGDFWEVRFALETKVADPSKETPRNVKTTVLLRSGSLVSLGGLTKTPPEGKGKATTLMAFIEISPSSVVLPTSATSGIPISR